MSDLPEIVIYTPEPASGAGRYVFELTRALAQRGMHLTLLAPDNFEYRRLLAEENRVGIETMGVRPNDPSRSFSRRVLDNVSFLMRSSLSQIRAMRQRRLIHIQFPLHLPFGLLPFVLAKLARCRIVFTAHDPVPHKWLMPPPLHHFERFGLACMYRLSDCIIVHSRRGQRTLIDTFGVSEAKLQIIAHGTFAVPGLEEPPAAQNTFRVLLFGALRENKGIHLAIQAVQNLAQVGVPIRLTIAGDTPNGKEAAYWETCQALLAKTPGVIEVRKQHIPEDGIPALLSACDCVLLPYTEFSSDSGVAALALSNYKPVIATARGGLADLLEAADLGIAIEEPTVAGVQDALLAAYKLGPEKLSRLGRNGGEYILSHCSWATIADRTTDLYSRLALAG